MTDIFEERTISKIISKLSCNRLMDPGPRVLGMCVVPMI